jgi:hypothetical protein
MMKYLAIIVVTICIGVVSLPARAIDIAGPLMSVLTSFFNPAGPFMAFVQQAMQSSNAALGQSIDDSIKNMLTGMSNLTDHQNNTNVDLAQQRELLETATRTQPLPNGCVTATMASRAAPAAAARAGYQVVESHRMAAGSLSSNTVSSDLTSIVNNHYKSFAGQQDVAAGRSQELSKFAPNGDVSFSTLLHGAQEAVASFNPGGNTYENFTFSDNQIHAARRYIDNAFNPFNTPNLTTAQFNTPQGRAYTAYQLAEAARLSVSTTAVADILASSMPVVGLGEAARGQWQKIAPDYARKLAARPDISYRELMMLEANRRYSSPSWYVMLEGLEHPMQVQKEQAMITASQLYVQSQLYRQNETMISLLAALNTTQTKSYFKPLIDEQRAALPR